MKEKTCCFTGHRSLPEKELPQIKKRLEEEVTALIRQGVIYYGAGGALGFDTLAALAVLKLKETYPQIRLILVLPCKEQAKGWPEQDVRLYQHILARADKAVYTSEHYHRGCMHKRNRHLVDNSGYLPGSPAAPPILCAMQETRACGSSISPQTYNPD